MNSPPVAVGDKVWYTAHTDHHLDKNHKGEPVFLYEHATNSQNPRNPYRKGDRVVNLGLLGTGGWTRLPDGSYQTPSGAIVKLAGPGEAWPAIVREVFADGTVALDIAHPIGASLEVGHRAFEQGTFVTLHYPSPGATTGLRYSAKGEPHTWHLPADKKAVS